MHIPIRLVCVFFVLLLVTSGPTLIHAQLETGIICVITFADVNGNGMQDADEVSLPGVNVNLSTGGVIIATHIMATEENNYCFENLLTGFYTITFTDNPLFRATTATEGTFSLAGGQRLTVNPFGAFPIPPDSLRAEVATQYATTEEPLDTATRLLLATGGSMLVMLLMIGIGAVILGMMSRRQRKPSGSAAASRRTRRGSKGRRQGPAEVIAPNQIKPPPG